MTRTNYFRRVFATVMTVCLPVAILASACADEGGGGTIVDNPDVPETQEPQDENTQGICLLNNCSSDEHCLGCGDNRNTCLEAENRCVACDPNTGEGCADGDYCTSFGLCAPNGVTCPTDDRGTPTITCTQNSDCLACSPMNQVCDQGACVACSGTNTQHCLSSDICVDGSCSAKCPQSCDDDNDCGQCGSPGNEAHACNAHKCAECSDTYPCAAGLSCEAGTCVAGCGIPGPASGECLTDEDCSGCGDRDAPASHVCKKPLNANGPTDRGTCAPQANGCSDLGQSVAVLPDPWSDVTNLCSNDNDCAGQGITFNVGSMIRDLVGNDEIDLGFTEIEIHDANIQYAMPVCADIELTNNISCGVCVPCQQDTDCAPIEIDPLIGDLFASDPLAQIAAALLFDLLWGDETEHNLNFFCADVAAGYGVCAPCGNPLQPCGAGQSGGSSGSGTCSHDVCDEGGALDGSCDTCANTVCDVDPYCCDTAWDDVCVAEAQDLCGACAGSGSGTCSHSECAEGGALDDNCSSCAAAVCAYDSFCCDNEWDDYCVSHVEYECATDFCSAGSGGGGSSCGADECSPTGGTPMVDGCSACVTAVCAQDDWCCTEEWDSLCVDIAVGVSSCGC